MQETNKHPSITVPSEQVHYGRYYRSFGNSYYEFFLKNLMFIQKKTKKKIVYSANLIVGISKDIEKKHYGGGKRTITDIQTGITVLLYNSYYYYLCYQNKCKSTQPPNYHHHYEFYDRLT